MQVRFNGYVISLPQSQIGSSGGRRSRAEKRSTRNKRREWAKKRETKPDRRVRPDQTPTHAPICPHFPCWRHRGAFACRRHVTLRAPVRLGRRVAPQSCIRPACFFPLVWHLLGSSRKWADGCVRLQPARRGGPPRRRYTRALRLLRSGSLRARRTKGRGCGSPPPAPRIISCTAARAAVTRDGPAPWQLRGCLIVTRSTVLLDWTRSFMHPWRLHVRPRSTGWAAGPCYWNNTPIRPLIWRPSTYLTISCIHSLPIIS